MEWPLLLPLALLGGLILVLALGVMIHKLRERRRKRRPHGEHGDTDSEVPTEVAATPMPPSPKVQHVYLMRHGERQDDVDPGWSTKAARPFDPPLSAAGVAAARQAGEALRGAGVQVVVASPFLRCVQTAVAVCEGLGFNQPVLLDNGLSEVHNVSVIKGASPPQPVVLAPQELARRFPGRVAQGVCSPVPMPEWGEERGAGGDAYQRFVAALARIAEAHAPLTVLAVSHGDAVAACVGDVVGEGVLVYRTDYCCVAHFVPAKPRWLLKTRPGDGLEWLEG